MEKKLQSILDYHEEKILAYERTLEKINAEITFYKEHNFGEELRIAELRSATLHGCVVKSREMHTEIKEVLNAWQS